MRKTTVVFAALLVLAAIPAIAQPAPIGFDNYHYNASMNCSDCHSMHASAHNNLTDGSAIITSSTTLSQAINPYYPAPNPGPGRHYLLKNDDVCASCHDGQSFAPDVIGAHGNGYIRSAGGTRAASGIGGGHVIGSTVNAPGWSGTATNNYFPAGSTLECFSCHSPHGSAKYRNLGPYQMRSTIGMAVAQEYLPTVAKQNTGLATTHDVTINVDGTAPRTWGTNLQNYYARGLITYGRAANGSEITFGGVKSSNRMDHFCGVCHGNFHGGEATSPVGDGAAFVRHPTSMVVISGAPTSAQPTMARSNLKVYQAATASSIATDSPGCLTCHKAHGNNNPFALIYPGFTAADTTEEGAGVYKSLCKSCHSMGGTRMD